MEVLLYVTKTRLKSKTLVLTKSAFGMILQSDHVCLLKEDTLSADTLRVKMAIVNIAHTEIQESRFEDGRWSYVQTP